VHASGIDDYLAKPIRGSELYRKVAPKKTTAETAGHSAPLPYDRTVAMGVVEGNEELLTTVVGIFCEEVDDLFPRIHEAINQSDAAVLQPTTHTLKPSTASLGVEAARAASLGLETLAKNGDLKNAPELAADLPTRFTELLVALEHEWPHA
jgi:HPt (histidine-containing phosphotransfer) domain-containing protein